MDDEALVDIEARRVLADAQLQRGDPRGELFALQDALERTPGDLALAGRIEYLIAEHHDTLYGPALAPLVRHPRNDDAPIEIRWRLGLARAWFIGGPERIDMDEVLADPLAAQLHDLTIVDGVSRDEVRFSGRMRAIRQVREHVRSLSIAASSELLDLGGWIGAMPELAELGVSALGELGRLHAPKLARATLSAIDVTGTLYALDLPGLRELALYTTPRANELVWDLGARWRSLAGLRRLSIAHSRLGVDGLDRILAHAKAFAHLELLDLSHNEIDPARVRDARDTIPGLQIEPMSLGAG